ncbi:unnamed protein product [Polarella glacialis]|uniref:Ubiquitin-like domain-containing protein n=1 Tax=Polarella glacialis TaxID=89957 RepID=A0A813GAS2_POLGL|nr:unnamed protein product [Polarella glacialis]
MQPPLANMAPQKKDEPESSNKEEENVSGNEEDVSGSEETNEDSAKKDEEDVAAADENNEGSAEDDDVDVAVETETLAAGSAEDDEVDVVVETETLAAGSAEDDEVDVAVETETLAELKAIAKQMTAALKVLHARIKTMEAASPSKTIQNQEIITLNITIPDKQSVTIRIMRGSTVAKLKQRIIDECFPALKKPKELKIEFQGVPGENMKGLNFYKVTNETRIVAQIAGRGGGKRAKVVPINQFDVLAANDSDAPVVQETLNSLTIAWTAEHWEVFLSRNGETGFTVQSLTEMKLSMKTGAPSVKMSNLLCFVWQFQAIKAMCERLELVVRYVRARFVLNYECFSNQAVFNTLIDQVIGGKKAAAALSAIQGEP